ncbi:hypothetical protein Vadar_030286 [Vaccinium darrowii]|nr:hypothetical protein Vadar_030286 [Vaccinium darrowii]
MPIWLKTHKLTDSRDPGPHLIQDLWSRWVCLIDSGHVTSEGCNGKQMDVVVWSYSSGYTQEFGDVLGPAVEDEAIWVDRLGAVSIDEKRSRLAWHLSDCFQKDSGRPGFPYCDVKSSMLKCRTKLDKDANKVFLVFYMETNSICHQLQTDAFKRQTERLVNELKKSAEFAQDKLHIIEEKAEELLQSSNHIHDYLASINVQTQKVSKMTKNVEDHVNVVLKHSEAVYKQSKEIAGSHLELQERQAQMKNKSEESMEVLHESYHNVVQEISGLKNEAVEIEKKIGKVYFAEVSLGLNNKTSFFNDKSYYNMHDRLAEN